MDRVYWAQDATPVQGQLLSASWCWTTGPCKPRAGLVIWCKGAELFDWNMIRAIDQVWA